MADDISRNRGPAAASASPPTLIDFIARLADAWDLRGNHCFTPLADRRALLALAYLPPELIKVHWDQLTGLERQKLLLAVRNAIGLGQFCAWILGEGVR